MKLRTLFSLFLALDATPAMAADAESIVIHPFKAQNALYLSGEAPAETLRQTTEGMLQNRGINPGLKLKLKSQDALQLTGERKLQTEDYSYEVDGYSLCNYQIKIHRSEDGATMIFGEMPLASGSLKAEESDWAPLAAAEELALKAQAELGRGGDGKIQNPQRCLLVEGGALKAVWQMDVMSKGLLYALTVDAERVYANEDKFFHAKGQTQVYATNSPKAPLTRIDLLDLADSGFLVNTYFETCVAKNADVHVCPTFAGNETEPFAKASAANSFVFDPEQQASSFTQASIFTNVNKALSWAKQQGYQNFGDSRIRLVAHATFSNEIRTDDPNNALYLPSTPPQIMIGDGDGNVLQNLALDEDVVGHEFGHHMVYHTVKNIRGEALVLHEGLADFLTFARTGNACLGETICPATLDGEVACYKPKACLRTGENELKWGAANLPRQAHLRGQLISGFMWDLAKKDNIPMERLTGLTFQAINLLVATSGYQHWILSLMLADKANNNGEFCPTILARAKTRGFEEFLGGVTCTQVANSSDARSVLDLKVGQQPAPQPAKSKKKGCGVISASSYPGQTGGFMLLWSIPLILAWFRRFRS